MTEGRPFAIVVCFEDERRERLVLARHADRGWEIPGGHLEPGETPREAAGREFAEEIGHGVEDLELLLVQDREVGTCHVFTGRLGPPVDGGTARDDKVIDWRLVEHLGQVEPLAFPDDPYEAMEAELGVRLRGPADDAREVLEPGP